MDKYEYRTNAEQIVKYVGKKKYAEAMQIADKIDWNRVKNIQMLCTVSDVYEKNERFSESREILYLAYDRSPADRMIIYKIVELSLAMGDLKEAVNYFREYSTLAPNDSNIYILKYKLYVANKANIETLISILEEFKEQEFHEDWGFELAKLYAQGGYVEQCIEMCDELDLWFNEGPYVLQALELKAQFTELTQTQHAKLEQGYAMLDEANRMEEMIRAEQEQQSYEPSNNEPSNHEPSSRVQNTLVEDEDIFYAGNASAHEADEMSEMNVGYEELPEEIQFESMRSYVDDYREKNPAFLDKSLSSLEYFPDDEDADYPQEEGYMQNVDYPREEGYMQDAVYSQEEDYPQDAEDINSIENSSENSNDLEESQDDDDLEFISQESEQLDEDKKEEEQVEVSSDKNSSKARQGGVFTKLGRLGKMLVEPAADYDIDEEDEELEETQSEEDIEDAEQNYEEVYDEEENYASEELEEESLESGNGKGSVKFVDGFSLGDIAAAQEAYEENSEDKTINVPMSDTKTYDKITIKSGKDRSVYERNMENAINNLDTKKVKKVSDLRAEQLKEELTMEEATPVWNGVSRYDTMNLQKELAKSIQKLLEATEKDDVDSTLEDVKRLVEDSNIPELTETMRFKTVRASMLNDWAKNQANILKSKLEVEACVERDIDSYSEEDEYVFEDEEIAQEPEVQIKKPEVEVIQSLKLKPTKEDRKRELEQILVQENDGQIGLIMPEQEAIEKQITGQLNIDDILSEWERQKNNEENEREKKELEKARNKALNETQEFMSQVMDLLNQCLPKCGEDDRRSISLQKQLEKVQQELNSTSDLSEISKLNLELADTLEKICPVIDKSSDNKEISGNKESSDNKEISDNEENLDKIKTTDAVLEENNQEDTEISEAKLEEETVINAEEISLEESEKEEPEKEQPSAVEMEAAATVDEVEEALQNLNINNAVKEELSEEDSTNDDISRMLEEALYNIAKEVQNNSQEKAVEAEPQPEESVKEQAQPAEEQTAEPIKPKAPAKQLNKNKELTSQEQQAKDIEDIKKSIEQSAASLADLKPISRANGLSDKQKSALSYFAAFEKVAEQVDKLLNKDNKGSENLIITGADGSGKTSLALRIVKAQQEENSDKVVAKIKGASLNSQDLNVVFEKVNGGVLVIEKAAALSDTTMKKLSEKLESDNPIQIILVTKKKSVERLLGRNPEFMAHFNTTIELPLYNNDELVEFAKTYAKANEYEIEDMAVLALFSRIGTIQTEHGAPNFNDVKDIIDEAIENANRRKKKIIKRIFNKKAEVNAAYLLEDDFDRK